MTPESLGEWKRTHSCGALRPADVGRNVTLMGWAFRRRDHGGLIFIDLRDREGVTQCVVDPAGGGDAHAKAESVRAEFVLAVRGLVAARPPGTENPKLATGGVEVRVAEMKILNDCRPLPFQLDTEGEGEVDETLRLKYRYLDMRRPAVFHAFQIRDRLCRAVRDHLHAQGFLEVETPFLTRSTPEGARDFLVPSRLQPGSFYALPQSPQLFKQLLMVAGFERYFQIVRCFRDEDLRRDRQPEFTQIDIETSFLDRDDFLPIVEGMVAEVWRRVKGAELARPFPRLGYDEAMARYGSDKPDLRFAMELSDVSSLFAGGEFQAFAQVVAGGGVVKALRVPGAGGMSRKELDDLTAEARQAGAKGLVWIKVNPDGLQSPVAKFIQAIQQPLLTALGAAPGDLLLLVGDAPAVAAPVLGRLRVELARRLDLIPTDRDVFAWIIDFPLVEWNEEEKRWDAVHHPFTAPRDEDLPLLETDPGRVRAKAYDLVLNGQEAAGGSIRIHQQSVQERLFALIGIGKEEARARFGFLLEALEFGAPPMGGIAFGLDRLAAVLAGQESIREVIAFPKTQKGTCPLTDAPAPVDMRQLRELGIRVVEGPGPS
ncbi:MAG: aspartate--tRNA ligase [Candidatus Rokuibacteriota bacterium]|nr:MAG: aspartate--tRNA ligase [Candidatus Rokubacteria bacterium]